MTVSEHHEGPCHYVFNTDVVEQDLSMFDISPIAGNSNNKGRGTVYFSTVNTSKGKLPVVIKRYRRGGMIRNVNKGSYLHRHYSQSRVWLEFSLLIKMNAMGLPVPKPVAGQVKRTFPGWYESTIITREIENAFTLSDYLIRNLTTSHASTLATLKKVGEVIRRFHDASIYHADLNASNILVTASNDIFLIDFDKGELLLKGSDKWKTGNLKRLKRSLLKFKKNDSSFEYSQKSWDMLMSGYSS